MDAEEKNGDRLLDQDGDVERGKTEPPASGAGSEEDLRDGEEEPSLSGDDAVPVDVQELLLEVQSLRREMGELRQQASHTGEATVQTIGEIEDLGVFRDIQRDTGRELRDEAEGLRIWERELLSEQVRFANNNRRTILKFILGLFAVWIVLSLFRLMAGGDIQVLTAGAAVLSGPLGVVIGYYYANDDKGRSSKQREH